MNITCDVFKEKLCGHKVKNIRAVVAQKVQRVVH